VDSYGAGPELLGVWVSLVVAVLLVVPARWLSGHRFCPRLEGGESGCFFRCYREALDLGWLLGAASV